MKEKREITSKAEALGVLDALIERAKEEDKPITVAYLEGIKEWIKKLKEVL